MTPIRLTSLSAALAASSAAAGPTCTPAWQVSPIGVPGISQVIRALEVYDDGTGPALYAGGPFLTAGGVTVSSIAKWDGSSWSPLGSGMVGPIPTSAAAVNGLGVHDDGSGPALYAVGNFLEAGGVPANRIAKWNGSAWSALGDGLNQGASALFSYDDGTGPALYVGGSFTIAGGVPGTDGLARWNGSEWSSVGGGVAGSCNTMAVFDDGTGPALYVGGTFVSAGAVLGTSRIAKWDGSQWSPVGGGIDGPTNPRVNALAVYDDGTGPALYAGGFFSTAGGVPAANLAKWDGTAWSEVGGGTDNTVIRMVVWTDDLGPALFVGGSFASVNNAAPYVVNGVARWDGEKWRELAGGVIHPTVTTVSGLVVHDDGSGESLFVAGGFTSAGGQVVGNIARWGCAGGCYANCDGSTSPPVLNVNDFICFQAAFAAGNSYANCDGSTAPPVLNVNDFVCFQSQFAAGCP